MRRDDWCDDWCDDWYDDWCDEPPNGAARGYAKFPIHMLGLVPAGGTVQYRTVSCKSHLSRLGAFKRVASFPSVTRSHSRGSPYPKQKNARTHDPCLGRERGSVLGSIYEIRCIRCIRWVRVGVVTYHISHLTLISFLSLCAQPPTRPLPLHVFGVRWVCCGVRRAAGGRGGGRLVTYHFFLSLGRTGLS